jgi:hypothetical protein
MICHLYKKERKGGRGLMGSADMKSDKFRLIYHFLALSAVRKVNRARLVIDIKFNKLLHEKVDKMIVYQFLIYRIVTNFK